MSASDIHMVPRRLREWVWDLVWETKHALVLDIGMVLDALRLASTVGRGGKHLRQGV